MGQLDVHIRHGGGGGTAAYIAAVLVAGGIAVAAALAVARAVASIPAWVWVLAAVAAVVMATGLIMSVWFLVRSNRAQGAAFTARREEMAATEALEAEARHRRAVERAAASAPVIHNWIVPEQIAAARERGFTPTTVFTGQKEIPQR